MIEMTGRTAEATLALPEGADKIAVDPEGDVLMTAEAAWGEHR